MNTRILIVDDEPAIVNALTGILEDEGYDVFSATSGQEALKLIKAEIPDMVFLDIWMPEMDGIETLRRALEIVSGLSDGARIVTHPSDTLVDGTSVRVAGTPVPAASTAPRRQLAKR